MLVPGTGADCTPEACGRSREPERQLKEVVSLRRVSSRGYLNASLTIPATKSRGKVAAMKSMSTRRRTLVVASSLALLSSLGLWATAVEAWWTPPPSLSCGSSTFPATGQITPATGTMTHAGATVRDDGFVKAGGALSYQDNGDGTVTDLNTLLMWEKKSMDGSLHDVSKTFVWSSPITDTVWDWIDAVNTELGTGIGFAGYNDWRLPNVRELQSIVDYGRSNPAVDPAFNNNFSFGCTVLTCSQIFALPYWSST